MGLCGRTYEAQNRHEDEHTKEGAHGTVRVQGGADMGTAVELSCWPNEIGESIGC